LLLAASSVVADDTDKELLVMQEFIEFIEFHSALISDYRVETFAILRHRPTK
jgi:hypothetical protein